MFKKKAVAKKVTPNYLRGDELIEKAIEIAKKAHRGVKRKNSDKPYFIHPEAVATEMTDPIHKAIAYLHDVIEDSKWTLDDLLQERISPAIVAAVDAISKKDNEEYLNYILRVKQNAYARTIKLADLKHNSKDLKKGTLKDKYMLSQYILTHSIGETVQKVDKSSV